MLGIALGIGIFFLESLVTTFMSLAGGWIAKVPDYLLAANVRAITSLAELPEGFSMGMGAGNTSIQMPGVIHAFTALTIYSLVFIVIGFYLFRKRDVTG